MICKNCNQTMMVPIWYGEPGLEEIILSREDKVVLGGLIVKDYTHFCHYCQTTYPEQED
jgi:hypothetical protein